MLWIKAFHIIFVVCWFAALFYLPRLFVYHANRGDVLGEQFKVMERRLYYGIMWPSGILTTVFGVWLLILSFDGYMTQGWMHLKLGLVLFLWIYHLYCGHFLKQFKKNKNFRSEKFYRFFNEAPTLLLISIVILVVVKPYF